MKVDLKEEVKITAGNIHKYLVELLVIHWSLISAYSEDFVFDKIKECK